MFWGVRNILKEFGADETGAILVEMTLVTPFVLLLSAGVFEFSNILYTRLLLDAGVSDAARYIARCSNDPSSSGWANCVAYAKNIAVTGSPGGGTARVTGWSTADVTVTPCAAPAVTPLPTGVSTTVASCASLTTDTDPELYRSNAYYVYAAEISTSFAYSGTGLWAYLGFGALTLTVSHQERLVGW